AMGHLNEVRDLAERIDNTWLAAISRMALGTLALVQSRLEEARPLLDEALGLSLATHSTRGGTPGLTPFARAARAAGGARGPRAGEGVRWGGSGGGGGGGRVAGVRQVLGTDRFDQVFAAGARLTQREAVAAARDRHSASTRLTV